ncbi:PREDICTED: putative F-box protein At3g52320 [Ipomoea nil]|uniref:putative F-box protein At3g52320 n=1 Tax=Ipomoea nil TaxID=35883 RepID=UPI0009017E69|nr:PREDICTED: putative F-box protein At3g52320 [Ipomoea nil]
MEDCRLSTDLVVDILSRLPVKSLMRFKCVCKFFYDLITSDRHFMDTHYGIRKAKTDCVLLEAGLVVREYYLLYKESSEIECIYLDIPPTTRVQWVKCCQGMLCLISPRNEITYKLDHGDYLIYDIWICNPSIKKVKALPSLTVPYRLPYDAFVRNEFGFGISNDMTLKVVMLLEIYSLDDGGRIPHQMTLVYSQVGGESWSLRQINNSVTSCCDIEGANNDFYLKGRYYWRAERVYDGYGRYLIWFDMNCEVFGTIELPVVSIYSVSIMNETIALLGYSGKDDWDFSCIEILLMMEDDNNTYWNKKSNIDCVVNVDNNESWRPIGIWNLDGELLVFIDHRNDWDSDHSDPDHAHDVRGVPYFISLDLVTQERKMFSLSKQRKSITIASNSTADF